MGTGSSLASHPQGVFSYRHEDNIGLFGSGNRFRKTSVVLGQNFRASGVEQLPARLFHARGQRRSQRHDIGRIAPSTPTTQHFGGATAKRANQRDGAVLRSQRKSA